MVKVWTAFLVCGATASVAAWAAALLHERGVRPFAAVTGFVKGLPWGGRLSLLPLFIALIAYGSTKHVGEGEVQGEGVGESVFNAEAQSRGDSQSGRGGSMTGLTGSAGLDGSLVNPAESNIAGNVVVCEDWLRFGGCEDWIYLGSGGWSFRHGSNFVERIAAFSSGKIRLLKQGGGRFC